MIEIIESFVCEQEKVNPSSLHSKTRKREIMEARQMVVYFAMKNGYSEAEAAGYYHLDHSTANHAKKKIKSIMFYDKKFRTKIRRYENELLKLGSTCMDIEDCETAYQRIEQQLIDLQIRIEGLRQRSGLILRRAG